MNERDNDRLIGMIIDEVKLGADKETLSIRFMGGIVATWETYGDCCSSTWIEDLTIPAGAIGSPITYVNDEGQVGSDEDEAGLLQYYKTVIGTLAGQIIVEYRNSSNGYYGGSLDGPELSYPK